MSRITPYRDREEAGALLAATLQDQVGKNWVVAAIPRGGVPVAWPIAQRLRAPLTLSFAHKLTLPEFPEIALGALDEDGELITSGAVLDCGTFDRLAEAQDHVGREIERQRRLYPAVPLADLLLDSGVILVDDGTATGLTLQAAIAHARHHGAREVIVATPCASVPAARHLIRLADRFVCPWVQSALMAVGEFYVDFHHVTDREVVDLLVRARAVWDARATPAGRS